MYKENIMIIIATIGPSIIKKGIIEEFLGVGVDAIRLNFSHRIDDEFEKIVNHIRKGNQAIDIMQDLSGKKIRVSNKYKEVRKIYKGEKVIFSGEDIYKKFQCNEYISIPINISNEELLNSDIKGISMKDNSMNFKIINKDKNGIHARVINGGVIRSSKGCNIRGFKRNNIELTSKDKKDIMWGAENNIDIVCQSFVESHEDIKLLRKYIGEHKGYNPKVYAKIETIEGIKNAEKIIKEADGIIIGRGDMVSETSYKEVPLYETEIIKTCNIQNKRVILGTHILGSMIRGDSESLPECEAIFNHIKVGASGFLLAGETSIGKNPIKSLRVLKNLIKYYEGKV